MLLNEVIPWGRSYEEYRLMFDLSAHDLAGRILGCGDGPASFNAEATAGGRSVVSCDPIYAFSREQIQERVEACYESVISQVRRALDGFVWDYFRDPDDLGRARLAAMQRFLADFEEGQAEGRYITAALPALPFASGQFDLALCSHLLFLYSDQLGFELHCAAIEEMVRVAGEVRIFPLLNLDRKPSPHLEPVQQHFRQRGWTAEVRRVPYEFQRGGHSVLCVRNSRNARR